MRMHGSPTSLNENDIITFSDTFLT